MMDDVFDETHREINRFQCGQIETQYLVVWTDGRPFESDPMMLAH